MILTTLLIGALLTGAVLTFIALGPVNPVPWLFLAAIGGVIFLNRQREKSHFVTWKDEYSVGIAQLDDDHRKLLNLINQFQTAVHYKTGEEFERRIMEELIDYTRTHFRREEELMQRYGYPELGPHRAEHAEMISRVENMVQKYKDEGYESFAGVADYLRDWLINHINGTDQGYSAFLRGKGVS